MLARRKFLGGLFTVPLAKVGFAQGLSVNVRDLGASGTGVTKDTAAIQRAVDRCGVLGGGEVLFPPGTYLSGAIALRSNTTLRLADGAVISSISGQPYLRRGCAQGARCLTPRQHTSNPIEFLVAARLSGGEDADSCRC